MSGDDLVQQLYGIIRPIDCADDWGRPAKWKAGDKHTSLVRTLSSVSMC